MKQQLIEQLESLNYPVFLQGSLNDNEEYPESFFTFWNFETPEEKYYNNEASKAVWGFWVYFYSADPDKVERVLTTARDLLRSTGFLVNGKGQDVASDVKTHTGRMIEVYGEEFY